MSVPIVALLTDFGTSDPYVGVMKGVILTRCPNAQCIDLTHEVAPQNVGQASYLLRTAYRYFPLHTVFLAVVDPGVGTTRRPIAIRTRHGCFVGPDNGLFSDVLTQTRVLEAVEISIPLKSSFTFHGRDIFAPAAAKLANGAALTSIGMPITDLQHLDPVQPMIEESVVRGEIIHIDHFGNAITSLGPCRWSPDGHLMIEIPNGNSLTLDPARCRVHINAHMLDQVRQTYGTVSAGSPLALVSSDGQLEIAVNGGGAARQLNLRLGDPITLQIT